MTTYNSVEQFIDLSQGVLADQQVKLNTVIEMFWQGVDDVTQLLVKDDVIFHLATSQGKDSTIVSLIALEAYKNAIASGKIEASRPLILSTVDTKGEAIPMTMYVSYAKKRFESYAASHNINIIYDVVSPALNDEYFIRFAGAQKLISNASRDGSCSVILKVEPSERYVKKIIADVEGEYKIISMTGSRSSDESARRTMNMEKQGVKQKDINLLRKEISQCSLGSNTLHKYAPIKDWTTEQVFDGLRVAGKKPLYKHSHEKGIPAFLNDYGLLLEVYGNGSNEVCEITVGGNSNSSGCNGSARFGCTFCTQIASKDKSSMALAELPRWRVLGVEDTLKFRDYLFRLSTDIDARAFHAKAHDPVGFNRVALQPNTLKPKYLEKMVRYASQLTLDSQRVAKEFRELVAQGREMEHEGYADIANDMMIPPKTKKAFLEMYRECVQDDQNLNTLFSQDHGLLLSFRWAVDGIGSVPFRPLAIWEQLKRGEGWIPYPMLNTEYEAKHGKLKLTGTKPLPEAIMVSVLKRENPVEFAKNPIALLDLWERPYDASDVIDGDMNCSLSRHADHLAQMDIQYTHTFSLKTERNENAYPVSALVDGKEQRFYVQYDGSDINGLLIDGKSVGEHAKARLLDSGVKQQLETHFFEKVEAICDFLTEQGVEGSQTTINQVLTSKIEASINANNSLKRQVNYLKKTNTFCGYSRQGRKVESKAQFTKRVTKVNNGVISRGNTRLSFYPMNNESRLHQSHKQENVLLVPEFGTHLRKTIGQHNKEMLMTDDVLENILVDQVALKRWVECDGVAKALEIHDDFLNTRIKKRHLRGYKKSILRAYAGTQGAEMLLDYGVITIEKAYYKQLTNTLKRTQLFNSMNLYQYQSMNYEDVASNRFAITMEQHRKDKASVLREVRTLRNESRKAAASIIASRSEVGINDSLELFEQTAMDAIDTAYHQYLSCSFHIQFDTHDVRVVNRANTSALWLALNLEGIKHIDSVLKLLLTQAQVTELKSRPQLYIETSKRVSVMLKCIQAHTNRALLHWDEFLARTTEIAHSDEEQDERLIRYAMHVNVQGFMAASINVTGVAIPEFHWSPNAENMTKILQNNLKKATSFTEQFKSLSIELGKTIETSVRKSAQKMSLSDRLTILNQRAA